MRGLGWGEGQAKLAAANLAEGQRQLTGQEMLTVLGVLDALVEETAVPA
jgi:hypothetical protein